MKFFKIFFAIFMISPATVGVASAENSLKTDAKALSFGITDGDVQISGRFFVMNNVAVLGGFGFAHTDNDANATDFSLSAGVRQYLGKSDLAPFVGGEVFYGRDERIVETAGGKTDVLKDKTVGINGHFGLEYFFTKQVSAEAQVGLELRDNSDGVDTTTIGTFRSGVTVNFYFP